MDYPLALLPAPSQGELPEGRDFFLVKTASRTQGVIMSVGFMSLLLFVLLIMTSRERKFLRTVLLPLQFFSLNLLYNLLNIS